MWYSQVPSRNHHDLHPLPGWTSMHILPFPKTGPREPRATRGRPAGAGVHLRLQDEVRAGEDQVPRDTPHRAGTSFPDARDYDDEKTIETLEKICEHHGKHGFRTIAIRTIRVTHHTISHFALTCLLPSGHCCPLITQFAHSIWNLTASLIARPRRLTARNASQLTNFKERYRRFSKVQAGRTSPVPGSFEFLECILSVQVGHNSGI